MIDRMDVPVGAGDLQTLARHTNMTAVIVGNAGWPMGMLIDHERNAWRVGKSRRGVCTITRAGLDDLRRELQRLLGPFAHLILEPEELLPGLDLPPIALAKLPDLPWPVTIDVGMAVAILAQEPAPIDITNNTAHVMRILEGGGALLSTKEPEPP